MRADEWELVRQNIHIHRHMRARRQLQLRSANTYRCTKREPGAYKVEGKPICAKMHNQCRLKHDTFSFIINALRHTNQVQQTLIYINHFTYISLLYSAALISNKQHNNNEGSNIVLELCQASVLHESRRVWGASSSCNDRLRGGFEGGARQRDAKDEG